MRQKSSKTFDLTSELFTNHASNVLISPSKVSELIMKRRISIAKRFVLNVNKRME